MAVSKVVLGDETLVDLTSDTVSKDTLLEGATAHAANGEQITGGVVVTPMYTGTKSAIESAIASGEIPEGAVVNITDDEEASSFQAQINEINNSLNALNDYTLIAEQQGGETWVDKIVDISEYRELFFVGIYSSDDNMFGNMKIPKSLLPSQAVVHFGSDALYVTVKFNSDTSISMYSKNALTGKLYGLK